MRLAIESLRASPQKAGNGKNLPIQPFPAIPSRRAGYAGMTLKVRGEIEMTLIGSMPQVAVRRVRVGGAL